MWLKVYIIIILKLTKLVNFRMTITIVLAFYLASITRKISIEIDTFHSFLHIIVIIILPDNYIASDKTWPNLTIIGAINSSNSVLLIFLCKSSSSNKLSK